MNSDMPYDRIQSTAPRRQHAFSLLEVMIAVAVLVVALSVTVSSYTSIISLQSQSKSLSSVGRIMETMLARINATKPTALATSEAPWSVARNLKDYGQGTGAAPLRFADLRAFGFATKDLDLDDVGTPGTSDFKPGIEIYIEYWRAVDYVAPGSGQTLSGLFQASYDSPRLFDEATYINTNDKADGLKSQFLLLNWDPDQTSPGQGPLGNTSILGESHPVAIRIIARWDFRGSPPRPIQFRELFTSRSP